MFYALIFVVGVWAARRRPSTTTQGLLVAGRGMPLFIGALTMTATWVGGGYINGTAEAVYDRRLLWAQAPWGFALSLVLGGLFFAAPMRRAGHTTLLDPFELRYGKPMAAVLFVPALVGEVFWSAAILAALGATFGTILDVDFSTAILISAAVAIGYTIIGGLWSVAYTDVLQLAFILLGLGAALPFVIDSVGGLETLLSGYREKFGSLALAPPAAAFFGDDNWGYRGWLWLDMACLLVLGGIPRQVYFQRVLACRDERTAVRLSLFAAVGCLVMAVPAGLIGAASAVADWQMAGVQPPSSPLLALPHALAYLTPPVVGMLGLGAVAAAVMSSVDSSILSAASMFTWNVYRPLARPTADDRELRTCMRAAVLVVGGLATGLALVVQSVYALWYLCADLVYVVLFPQLVAALFFRRATRIGALAGAAVALVLRLGGGEPLLDIPALIPYPMVDAELGVLFPFRTCAMLAGLTTIYIVSLATNRRSS